MTTKIKISLDDPEMREIWDTALAAKREVASWPAWKRGEEEVATVTSGSDSSESAPASTPGTKL